MGDQRPALDGEAEIRAVRDDTHRHVALAVRLDGAPADGERLRLDVGREPAGTAEDDLARAELVCRPRDRWRWRYLACRLGRPESPVALDALFAQWENARRDGDRVQAGARRAL